MDNKEKIIKGIDDGIEIEKSLILLRKNLHYLRKKVNGFSLDKVASETDISRDGLFKLEKDYERSPNLRTVLSLCMYYQLPIGRVGDLLTVDLERKEKESLSNLEYDL